MDRDFRIRAKKASIPGGIRDTSATDPGSVPRSSMDQFEFDQLENVDWRPAEDAV